MTESHHFQLHSGPSNNVHSFPPRLPRQRIDRYKAETSPPRSYIRHGLGQIRCHHPRTNRAASATKASRAVLALHFPSVSGVLDGVESWGTGKINLKPIALNVSPRLSKADIWMFTSVECMHMNHEVNHLADPPHRSTGERAPCSFCHGLHYAAAGVHFGPLSDRFRR